MSAVRGGALPGAVGMDAWRRLVHVAATIAQAPTSSVTVVEADPEGPCNRTGSMGDGERSPDEHALCRAALERDAPIIVANASSAPDAGGESAVDRVPVAAYASFPVKAPDGHVVGAFCVIDTEPRTWEPTVMSALAGLAATAEREVALKMLKQRDYDSRPQVKEPSWDPAGYTLLIVHADGTLTTRVLPGMPVNEDEGGT